MKTFLFLSVILLTVTAGIAFHHESVTNFPKVVAILLAILFNIFNISEIRQHILFEEYDELLLRTTITLALLTSISVGLSWYLQAH